MKTLDIHKNLYSLKKYNIGDVIYGSDFTFSTAGRALSTRCLFYIKELNILLISHTNNHLIHLINVENGDMKSISHHSATVRDVGWENKYVVSASWDGSVRLSDLFSLKSVRVFTEPGLMARCPEFHISKDRQYIYSVSYDTDLISEIQNNVLRIWELKNGRLKKKITLPGRHLQSSRSASIVGSGNSLFVISDSGTLAVYSPNGEIKYVHDFRENVRTMLLLPNYNQLVITSDNGFIYLVDSRSYTVRTVLTRTTSYVKSLIQHPTRTDIVIGGTSSGRIHVWQLPDFKEINQIETEFDIWSFTFVNSQLVVGGCSSSIYIFDFSDPFNIKHSAELEVHKDYFFFKEIEAGCFFTNAADKIRVTNCKTKSIMEKDMALNLIGFKNNIKAMHDVFDTDFKTSSFSKYSSLPLQLPEWTV